MKIFAAVGNHAGFIPACGELLFTQERRALQGCWYEIPDSSIIRSGNPFFVPDFDQRFIALPSVAVKICRLGKSVAPRFASRYYDEITLGFSVVAADRLRKFIPVEECGEEFVINAGGDELKWKLDSAWRHIDEIISEISRGCTIKTGDIILPHISPSGIRLLAGDHISVKTTDSSNILDINIR